MKGEVVLTMSVAALMVAEQGGGGRYSDGS